ncbi:MAG TPA: PD-(D/E)XK nuclease family protein [Candidatus Saccharimonadales bacterium]
MGNYYREHSQPYKPGQTTPFKISRSKIELYVQCRRCFWLDARLKIKRPNGPPFSLNNAVDGLLKKEFDSYRKQAKAHPLMSANNIVAIPFSHPDIDTWRENFVGVNTVHQPTNLYVFGAIDDVWVTNDDELIVVDYKATSKSSEVSIDAAWQDSYKRQVEVYQWLLRQNGFKVSNRAIFVYTNGRLDLDEFGDRLEFKTKIIDYDASDSWIEPTLSKIKDCLEGPIPKVGVAAMGGPCDYCDYARKRTELTLKSLGKN